MEFLEKKITKAHPAFYLAYDGDPKVDGSLEASVETKHALSRPDLSHYRR